VGASIGTNKGTVQCGTGRKNCLNQDGYAHLYDGL
jgi:hypothetical protein